MNRAVAVLSRFAGKQFVSGAAPKSTRPLSTVAANTIKIIFVDQEVRRGRSKYTYGTTVILFFFNLFSLSFHFDLTAGVGFAMFDTMYC